MIKLCLGFATLAAFTVLFFGATPAPSAYAAIKDNLCGGADINLSETDSGTCEDTNECVEGSGDNCVTEAENKINSLVALVVNILSAIVGVLAVIFIIVGAFRYVTSGGDSGKLGSAKSSIVYALIGLVIVAIAQFVVRFVLSKTT